MFIDRLLNTGNAPVTAELSASDPDELLAFDIEPTSLTVGPGEPRGPGVEVLAGAGFQRAPQKGADRTATTTISFAGSIRGTTIGLRGSIPGWRSAPG